MYYVEDGEEPLRARLDRALAALDGGTLYADLGGAEATTNGRAERVLSGFVNGAARRASPAEMRQRIAAGEVDGVSDPDRWGPDVHALVHDDEGIVFPYAGDGATATLVDALAANRAAVGRVDVGPTGGGLDPADRDREWAAHVARAVETGWADPDETLVVMGGDSDLDRHLSEGVHLPDHGVTVPGFDLTRPGSLADRIADRVDRDGDRNTDGHSETPAN